jgi:hypothetical protein
MKFKLTLVREFDDSDYFADSMVNDVGEIDDHIGNDEATSAVRDGFMTGFIDALDILDPEHTDWRVEVLDDGDAPSLQAYLTMDEVQVEVGTADNVMALYPITATERIIMGVAPEQLMVWAAQLRVVADRCDDLAAMAQPQICFPAAGMEEV